MSEGGAERVREVIDDAEEIVAEAPRPLMRELPPADPFPADALGELLGAQLSRFMSASRRQLQSVVNLSSVPRLSSYKVMQM
jgi:hypothetical protein